MSDALPEKRRLKPKLPNGERECYVTLLNDGQMDIVLGASTKRELSNLVKRLFPDVTVVKTTLHRSFFRKAT